MYQSKITSWLFFCNLFHHFVFPFFKASVKQLRKGETIELFPLRNSLWLWYTSFFPSKIVSAANLTLLNCISNFRFLFCAKSRSGLRSTKSWYFTLLFNEQMCAYVMIYCQNFLFLSVFRYIWKLTSVFPFSSKEMLLCNLNFLGEFLCSLDLSKQLNSIYGMQLCFFLKDLFIL